MLIVAKKNFDSFTVQKLTEKACKAICNLWITLSTILNMMNEKLKLLLNLECVCCTDIAKCNTKLIRYLA